MSYQKKKISEYLDNLYTVLVQNNCIDSTLYFFKKAFQRVDYENGIASIGSEILYRILVNDIIYIQNLHKTINVDYSGSIQKYLSAEGYIIGKVSEPKKGFSRFSWILLEKIADNNLTFINQLRERLIK